MKHTKKENPIHNTEKKPKRSQRIERCNKRGYPTKERSSAKEITTGQGTNNRNVPTVGNQQVTGNAKNSSRRKNNQQPLRLNSGMRKYQGQTLQKQQEQ